MSFLLYQESVKTHSVLIKVSILAFNTPLLTKLNETMRFYQKQSRWKEPLTRDHVQTQHTLIRAHSILDCATVCSRILRTGIFHRYNWWSHFYGRRGGEANLFLQAVLLPVFNNTNKPYRSLTKQLRDRQCWRKQTARGRCTCPDSCSQPAGPTCKLTVTMIPQLQPRLKQGAWSTV